jgi:hypothetical protein
MKGEMDEMDKEMTQPLDPNERRALVSILTPQLEHKKRGCLNASILDRITNFLRSDNSKSTDNDIFSSTKKECVYLTPSM